MSAKRILPIIVFSQFLCTSLWFAGNAVMSGLANDFQLENTALGHITSAVLFGFITGTLVYAVFNIADRFSPSLVFLISALAGALCNLGIIMEGIDLTKILLFRFLTGFFIAGIYPVGMKIAADYYQQGLGKSLGFLVGALVLGTGFPHLLNGLPVNLPWHYVLVATSALAVFGGVLIFALVPNGPYRKPMMKLELTASFKVFKNKEFRAAAFGYFGHMWELFAFWAFVPVMLAVYLKLHPGIHFNVPVLSFLIIGSGGLACVLAGYISEKKGVKSTAAVCSLRLCFICLWLLLSGFLCSGDSPLLQILLCFLH